MFDELTKLSDLPDSLISLLKCPNVHIAIISKGIEPPSSLIKELDHKLLRGCRVYDITPLSIIHSSQRIVHELLSNHHLAPTNEDQSSMSTLSHSTFGSPILVDIVSALIAVSEIGDIPINKHISDISNSLEKRASLAQASNCFESPEKNFRSLEAKGYAMHEKAVAQENIKISSQVRDDEAKWNVKEGNDSWDIMAILINISQLSNEEQLLLYCLSVFNCAPVPQNVVEEISVMISKATQQLNIALNLPMKLTRLKLLKYHPHPCVYHPSVNAVSGGQDATTFYYIPQLVSAALWNRVMTETDRAVTLGIVYKALSTSSKKAHAHKETYFLHGLSQLLLNLYESNYTLMKKECFQAVYRLCLSL